MWAFTTSRCDTSDLWLEQLNEEETHYLLDGEYRELEVITEHIRIKGQPDHILKIKQTHRGPVIPGQSLKKNSSLLFGGEAPALKYPGNYSFGWGGQFVGENTYNLMKKVYEYKDIPTLFKSIDSEEFDDYRGLGQNTIFADTQGNIGYRLIMTIPERKDKTPFISSRVLDGTTSEFDWTGKIVPLRDLPKSLNPKKGFLQTSNGRQTSDHAVNDYGAASNSPPRTLRIDELLREGVSSGKKFTLADMGAI